MPRASGKPKKRVLLRAFATILVALPILALVLWIAIHKIPWLGPLLADTARSIVGPGPIAKVEDYTYGLQDKWNLAWRSGEQPEAYWEVPETPEEEPAPVPVDEPQLPVFMPNNVQPMHKNWSAPGDGVWVPVVDKLRPDTLATIYKTLLHPDRNRSWTAVTIVAVDLQRVRLHAVPGRWEPRATESSASSLRRTGLVPEEDHDGLMAVFNGGFKYEHGRYGMRVDGVTIVRPRPRSCTIAMHTDDRLEIGTWERFASTNTELRWWRQTPACMWENGKMHVGLTVDDNTAWGATVDGDTIIRRSAIGIDESGQTLFVGIGESTTARAIALAMRHAGANSLAQLDVNWSFPKFMTIERKNGDGDLICVPITKGFEFDESDFIRKPYARDFFYLTQKPI